MIIIALSTALCVSFLIFGIYYGAEEKAYERHLKRMSGGGEARKKSMSASKLLQSLFENLGNLIINSNKYSRKYGAWLRENLGRVESVSSYSASFFVTGQILCGIIIASLMAYLLEVANPGLFFFFFLAGLFPPLLWVQSRIQAYKTAIFRELPDVVDILAMAMEAGLDLNAAVDRLIKRSEKNILVLEFKKMYNEIQMGESRLTALQNMADRVDEPAFSGVILSLIQGLKLGSSLAPVLKAQSAHIRVLRSQMSEKLASEAPLKLLFPLLFFIFPTIFIILFGPIVLMFSNGGF